MCRVLPPYASLIVSRRLSSNNVCNFFKDIPLIQVIFSFNLNSQRQQTREKKVTKIGFNRELFLMKRILSCLLLLFLCVSAMQAQSYTMPSGSGSADYTTCSGTFYDAGGVNMVPTRIPPSRSILQRRECLSVWCSVSLELAQVPL